MSSGPQGLGPGAASVRAALDRYLAALKAAFDVHDLGTRFRDRLPAEWQAAFEEHRAGLDRLVQGRSRALYGDEADDVPASEIFTEDDARQAMLVVDRFLELYGRLLGPEV